MKTIKGKDYKVHIGSDVLDNFEFDELGASRFVVITDSNVKRALGRRLMERLAAQNQTVQSIVLKPGEAAKNLAQVEKILRVLADKNVDRQAIFIALGGGVIGDLTGLIACLYKRGVRFVQIPTSLLAQADSSIGAKNGVNLPEGKNLVGTSYSPVCVLADTSLLASLPETEVINGLAEVIKYGVVWDKKLFSYLERNMDNRTAEFYDHVISRAAEIKLKITDQDPNDQNIRQIINYGHTVGHALEIASGFSLTHGQAVALGMVVEGYIANRLEYLSDADLERQNNLLARLHIHTKQPFKTDQLIRLMRRDKKSVDGALYFVQPVKIGKVRHKKNQVSFEVQEDVVREALALLGSLSQ